MPKRKKLGEILVESGLLDEMQLKSALGHQRQWGGRLGEVLVNGGFATEDEIAECLAAQLDLPRIDLYESGVDTAAASLLPVETVESNEVLPVRLEGELGEKGAFLWVATADPTNLPAIDEVQFRTGKRVRPVVVTPTQLHAAIRFAYYGEPLVPPRDLRMLRAEMDTAGSSDAQAAEGRRFDGQDRSSAVLDADLPAMRVFTEEGLGSDGEPRGRSLPPDQYEALSVAIESIVAGGSMPKEMQRLVNPTQMLSAMIRVLIGKNVCDISEFVDEIEKG